MFLKEPEPQQHMTLLTKLFGEKCKRKNKKPLYGWSIFATDDKVHLTRRVTEAQRVQMQNLY
jgi:hypothetical protein